MKAIDHIKKNSTKYAMITFAVCLALLMCYVMYMTIPVDTQESECEIISYQYESEKTLTYETKFTLSYIVEIDGETHTIEGETGAYENPEPIYEIGQKVPICRDEVRNFPFGTSTHLTKWRFSDKYWTGTYNSSEVSS